MQFCMPHWTAMRAAVEARGMTRFVAKDGAAAVRRARAELEGAAGPDDFDPLMSMHNAIFGRALDMLGLGLMVGDKCPLCELNAAHKAACTESGCTFTYDEGWINGSADDAKAYIDQHLRA